MANALARTGVRVSFLLSRDNRKSVFGLEDGVDVRSLKGSESSWFSGTGFLENVRLLILIRIRVWLLKPRSVMSFIAPTNVITAISLFGSRTKVVVSERNDPAIQSFGRGWDILRRYCYRRANIVTANSLGALKSLSAFVPAGKLQFLPNPISVKPDPRENASQRKETLLAVGRLHHQKGFDLLLRAFAELNRLGEAGRWRIRIAGVGGLQEELQSLARALEISDSVDWLGFQQNLSDEYASAGIFVMPSRFEGMPNALMEALAFGMPAIVSDGSRSMTECVEFGRFGLIFHTENVEELANCIRKLIGDRELRETLGADAKKHFSRFSEEEVLKVWRQVLEI